MTASAKAVCLRLKVAQLNSLSVRKEITGIPSRPTGILQHWKCFTYSFEAGKQGEFCFSLIFDLIFYFFFNLFFH